MFLTKYQLLGRKIGKYVYEVKQQLVCQYLDG